MKEIVVISGKGGTGKTSIVACFAFLAKNKVLADCDVDAADLYLVLEPAIRHSEPFKGGKEARIKQDVCVGCGVCEEVCRFDAVYRQQDADRPGMTYVIDPISCEGCGVCSYFCPIEAIELEEVVNGEWFISDTRCGPMVHARLGIAQENSGKLVTLVRAQAKRVAEEQALELLIVDGSPGIGCPVIASITGADMVVAVTEPTLSAQHDLERVCELASHFSVPVVVCINKYDLNKEMASSIEEWCFRKGLEVVGKIPYDTDFTMAQVEKKSLVEYSKGVAAGKVELAWERISDRLNVSRTDGVATSIVKNAVKKEDGIMRIAIPVAQGRLSLHFGHCEEFVFVDVDPEKKVVIKKEMVSAPGHQPGVLPKWLHEKGADVIIAGGMGRRAQGLFAENGIQVVVGSREDDLDHIITNYLEGSLQTGSNICDH